MRWFDKDHSGIIAMAAVVEINDNRAKIAFEPFVALEQKAFPTPLLKPQKTMKLFSAALMIEPF